MVLKFPLTKADSTNGLHKYNGFDGDDPVGDGGTGGGGISGGKVAEVGVGDLLGPRGARLMDRLYNSHKVLRLCPCLSTIYNAPNRIEKRHVSEDSNLYQIQRD